MAEEIAVVRRTPLETYRGSCHCGMVVFTLQVPEIKAATQCDCSICTKKGNLWFFPGDGITLNALSSLVTYRFGSKEGSHKVRGSLASAQSWHSVTDIVIVLQHMWHFCHGL
jgi:hypothetical protein